MGNQQTWVLNTRDVQCQPAADTSHPREAEKIELSPSRPTIHRPVRENSPSAPRRRRRPPVPADGDAGDAVGSAGAGSAGAGSAGTSDAAGTTGATDSESTGSSVVFPGFVVAAAAAVAAARTAASSCFSATTSICAAAAALVSSLRASNSLRMRSSRTRDCTRSARARM